MYAGQVVESPPTARLFADAQHPYTLGLIGSMPSLGARSGRLATIPGLVPTPEAMPEGCRFADRCPFALPLCAEAPALRTIAEGHSVACHRAPIEASLSEVAA
jgi:oligopeptide/dipeptide ABC transporter ATP-binding protein